MSTVAVNLTALGIVSRKTCLNFFFYLKVKFPNIVASYMHESDNKQRDVNFVYCPKETG